MRSTDTCTHLYDFTIALGRQFDTVVEAFYVLSDNMDDVRSLACVHSDHLLYPVVTNFDV